MSKSPWIHAFDALSVELFAKAAAKAAERSAVEAQKMSGAAATMAATAKSGGGISGGLFLAYNDWAPEPFRPQNLELPNPFIRDTITPLADSALGNPQQLGQR